MWYTHIFCNVIFQTQSEFHVIFQSNMFYGQIRGVILMGMHAQPLTLTVYHLSKYAMKVCGLPACNTVQRVIPHIPMP